MSTLLTSHPGTIKVNFTSSNFNCIMNTFSNNLTIGLPKDISLICKTKMLNTGKCQSTKYAMNFKLRSTSMHK
jgi:hypothetical protein